jgi:hypothetical protein
MIPKKDNLRWENIILPQTMASRIFIVSKKARISLQDETELAYSSFFVIFFLPQAMVRIQTYDLMITSLVFYHCATGSQ